MAASNILLGKVIAKGEAEDHVKGVDKILSVQLPNGGASEPSEIKDLKDLFKNNVRSFVFKKEVLLSWLNESPSEYVRIYLGSKGSKKKPTVLLVPAVVQTGSDGNPEVANQLVSTSRVALQYPGTAARGNGGGSGSFDITTDAARLESGDQD